MSVIQDIKDIIKSETGHEVKTIIDYREAGIYVIIIDPPSDDYICDPYSLPVKGMSNDNLSVFLPFDDQVGKFSSLPSSRVIYNSNKKSKNKITKY